MKYWQIVYRTGEEEYATKEILVDDNQYKQIQQAILRGEDFIVIEDRPTIKRTSIASINEADQIVQELENRGIRIGNNKQIEAPQTKRLTGQTISNRDLGFQRIAEIKHSFGWDK